MADSGIPAARKPSYSLCINSLADKDPIFAMRCDRPKCNSPFPSPRNLRSRPVVQFRYPKCQVAGSLGRVSRLRDTASESLTGTTWSSTCCRCGRPRS